MLRPSLKFLLACPWGASPGRVAEEPQARARGRCWARCMHACLGCFMAAAAHGQRRMGFIQAERIVVLPSSLANGASLFFLTLKIKKPTEAK